MTARAIEFSLPQLEVRCSHCGTTGHVRPIAAGRIGVTIECACSVPDFEIVYSVDNDVVASLPLRPTRSGKR